MSSKQEPLCRCGHSREDHADEPPYGCQVLLEGVDCEDDDYCECGGYRPFAKAEGEPAAPPAGKEQR